MNRRIFSKILVSLGFFSKMPVAQKMPISTKCLSGNHLVLSVRKGKVIGYVKVSELMPDDKIWNSKEWIHVKICNGEAMT